MASSREALTAREAHQQNIELLNAIRVTQVEQGQILAQHGRILARHEERLNSIDARMDSIDARMDSIDARMDSIDQRMDSIDGKLGQLALGMHTIESLLRRLTDEG